MLVSVDVLVPLVALEGESLAAVSAAVTQVTGPPVSCRSSVSRTPGVCWSYQTTGVPVVADVEQTAKVALPVESSVIWSGVCKPYAVVPVGLEPTPVHGVAAVVLLVPSR